MKRTATILIGVAIALVLVGAAFWEGMNVGKAQAQSEQNAFFASRGFDPNNLPAGGFGGQGRFGTGTRGAATRGATGTIQSIEGNTITLQDPQGNTVTVTITDNTPVIKTVQGTKSDLKVGQRIVVQGDRSGNNVSATGIQISDLPEGMQSIFRRPGATPTPTPGR